MPLPRPGYFCAMRIADNRVASILGLYDRDLADRYDGAELRAIVRRVFHDRLGWDAAQLELRRQDVLTESELVKVYEPLERLVAGQPLQYALGRTWFHGLLLHVGPGVLIPRPETEEMVAHILQRDAHCSQVVDIGTGSGCIALALKAALPRTRTIGVDTSEEALHIARGNGRRLGVEVEWVHADVLDPTFRIPPGTDLLVSNPPYVPRSEETGLAEHVRAHEPHLALFVDADDPLLFFRRLAGLARQDMRPGGTLWFEGHLLHSMAVGEMLDTMGFRDVEVKKDLSGNPRFIRATR